MGVGALAHRRSRPAVALTGSTPGYRPPLRMTQEAEVGCQEVVRSTFGDPDLRSPSGFDSGLSPSAQDDTERREWGAEVGALDDWRSRPAVALRVRLRASPSAQDDTEGRGYAISMPGTTIIQWLPQQCLLTYNHITQKQTKAFSSGRRWQPQADG